jgi:serine/threonine protein kinase
MPGSVTSAGDDVDLDRLENPAMYKPGGYHPIAIGDELHNGRYRIIHSLGHGTFSTVWLALDQRYEKTIIADANTPCSRYVAVKISTACSQNDEVAILRQLQGRPQSQFPHWKSRLFSSSLFGGNTERDKCRSVVAMLDEFETHGPNGLHRCLVTELLGPSVNDIKRCPAIEGWHLLPLHIARQAAVQCAEAVAWLHSHGIVHGGTFYR